MFLLRPVESLRGGGGYFTLRTLINVIQETQNIQQGGDTDLLCSRGEIQHRVLFLLPSLDLPPSLPRREAQAFTLHPQPELCPLTAGWFVSSFLKCWSWRDFVNISANVNNVTLIVWMKRGWNKVSPVNFVKTLRPLSCLEFRADDAGLRSLQINYHLIHSFQPALQTHQTVLSNTRREVQSINIGKLLFWLLNEYFDGIDHQSFYWWDYLMVFDNGVKIFSRKYPNIYPSILFMVFVVSFSLLT